MPKVTRKEFLLTLAGAGAAVAVLPLAATVESPTAKIKLGVTLVSFTGSYGPASLLDTCFAEASAIGAKGIELLSQVHIPSYPNPEDKWIEHWRELTRQYKVAASCYNCSANPRLQTVVDPGSEEAIRTLVRDFELAAKLGFDIVRPAWDNAPPAMWQTMATRVLPYAEKYRVRLAVETHSLNTAGLDGYLKLVDQVTTKRLGLLVDVGRLPAEEGQLAALLPRVIYIRRSLPGLYIFRNDTSCWELRKQTGKDGMELANLIGLLAKAAYNGYLSSEYEGPHVVMLASNHLRQQHVMVNRHLGEYL